MRTLLIALFLFTAVVAPTSYAGEKSGPKEDVSTDKKPPHGDDGTGGNGGNGGGIIFIK